MTLGDLITLLREFPEENEVRLGDGKEFSSPARRVACVTEVSWSETADSVETYEYVTILP